MARYLVEAELAEREFERLKKYYAGKLEQLRSNVFEGVHELSGDDETLGAFCSAIV